MCVTVQSCQTTNSNQLIEEPIDAVKIHQILRTACVPCSKGAIVVLLRLQLLYYRGNYSKIIIDVQSTAWTLPVECTQDRDIRDC